MPGGSHGAAGAPVSNRRDGWPSRDAGWTPALRPAVIGHWSLVILSSLVIGHWSFAQSNLPPATVSFLDGSFLRGGIGSLNSDTLRWLHPNARAPIEFSTTNLNLIRLPTRSTNLPTNAGPVCRVVLASGDEFEGQLLSLDADSFEIETWFAGKLRGQRAGLASLAFYGSSQSALYDGPRAAEEWKVSTGAATVNRVGVNILGGRNFIFGGAVPAAPAVPVAPQAVPIPAPAVPQQLPIRALPIAPNRVAPPPAPAVDPVVQAVRAEVERAIGKAAAPGALPVLPPADLTARAAVPKRVFTVEELGRLSDDAERAATLAVFLKTDLVKEALQAGQTSPTALERWFADFKDPNDWAKDEAKAARFKVMLRAEVDVLVRRLQGRAAPFFEAAPGLAPLPLPGAVPPPVAGVDLVQGRAVGEILKQQGAAMAAVSPEEFLKSDLVQAAVDAGLASRRAEEEWLARYERDLQASAAALRVGQMKLVIHAEAAHLAIRLLQARAPDRAAQYVPGMEQTRERNLGMVAQQLEARAVGNAAANALADARVRALDALRLNNPNLAVAIGAEGALAGRAAVAGAANPNAAWQFRDGAYYSAGVGTLGRECQLPTKTRIEFDLAWKGQPYFRFSFFTRSTEHYDYSDGWQFYTSSSGYIYSMRRSGMGATSSSGARVPQMLAKNTVRFTFLVNTEAETVVLLADGEKVHEWKGLGSPGPGTGIVFYNYNSNSRVRLSDIRVAPWDGRERDAVEPLGAPGTDPDKLVEVPPADSAVVEFANRDRATGTLHGIRDGRLSFNPAGTKLEIPLARAALIAFPVGDAPALPKVEGVQVTLHRNERLTLALEKWEAAEIIAVSPVFGRLKLKPEAVRALRFNPSATRGPVDEWSGP
ncbi:MAG: hypothetical protein FD161_4752 [Limisphaerales bacterium]|nr:MAG: hypothetical protein FD161_4752 [Limisphaerales bacterium]TXT44843.1 MAG: hypothetical protein FD140_4809 [Limisphaerales bacterium]